jgi:hypothetical protein
VIMLAHAMTGATKHKLDNFLVSRSVPASGSLLLAMFQSSTFPTWRVWGRFPHRAPQGTLDKYNATECPKLCTHSVMVSDWPSST